MAQWGWTVTGLLSFRIAPRLAATLLGVTAVLAPSSRGWAQDSAPVSVEVDGRFALPLAGEDYDASTGLAGGAGLQAGYTLGPLDMLAVTRFHWLTLNEEYYMGDSSAAFDLKGYRLRLGIGARFPAGKPGLSPFVQGALGLEMRGSSYSNYGDDTRQFDLAPFFEPGGGVRYESESGWGAALSLAVPVAIHSTPVVDLFGKERFTTLDLELVLAASYRFSPATGTPAGSSRHPPRSGDVEDGGGR